MASGNLNFTDSFEKLSLPIYGVRFPVIEISEDNKKKYKLNGDCSNYDFLKILVWEGFKRKIEFEKGTPEYHKYVERVKYELSIYSELEFVDYLLLVWDIIDFCKKNDIATGMGRGSVCGSLVAYLIDITEIDSIKYNLYFERFINKTRAKKNIVNNISYIPGELLPDIDMDFSYEQRSKVIEYLYKKYEGHVSKILTHSTLSGKILIKECGKLVGAKSETEMIEVADMIPKIFGQVKDIESAYKEVKKFKEWCDKNKEIYEIALKLRDLIKNKGSHASGYVVSYENINSLCPLELNSEKELVASYDMKWMNLLAIKIDLLGLRAASLIHNVCKSEGIEIKDIDLEDKLIYDNLQNLRSPHGIFQIEADTNYSVLNEIKPKNLNQLAAVLALARPGALEYVDKYSEYMKTGRGQSVHPFFDDVLKETGFIPLYQEQMMKMANKIGFSLEEAETCRKIVGKKLINEVNEWEEKVKQKVKENNLPVEVGDVFWKLLKESVSYSFNAGHAFAYATTSALTAYLKFKYPQQFYLALLQLSQHEPNPFEEISKIEVELQYFNMRLLPPHLVKSDLDFKAEGGDIRFGLSAIKGISDKTIIKLLQFKREHANKFELFENGQQSKLSVGVMASLIQSGALEGVDGKTTRSKMVLECLTYNLLTDKEKKLCLDLGKQFNYNLLEIIIYLNKTKNEKGILFIKDSRFQTIKKHYEPYKEIYKINSQYENLACWWYEKKVLGYAYSCTLNDVFKKANPSLRSVLNFTSLEQGDYGELVGIVDSVHSWTTKTEKKTKCFQLFVSDETGKFKILAFNEKIENIKNTNRRLPVEGDIVTVRGQKKTDACFADYITIQSNKVFMKLSELKDFHRKEKDEEKEKVA
jgi:DNA polymerase-3 subunit alpha